MINVTEKKKQKTKQNKKQKQKNAIRGTNIQKTETFENKRDWRDPRLLFWAFNISDLQVFDLRKEKLRLQVCGWES